MYKLLLPLCFWICSCADPVHPGDAPGCPRHGPLPQFLRVLLAIILIILALLPKG